ncbi:MAG: thermonuclease family protein [Deltaproteobacteria bacterium]|nr:thermonuclease family protein [Deltaproteobacteria bacterium]
MEENLYYYRALVCSVYDGDTCTVDIDLGLGTWVHGEKLRFSRINAPEIRGAERPAGLLSRDFLISRIGEKEILIKTVKDKKGKYGRYLAEIILPDGNGGWINVNDLMVEEGHAVYVEY